MPNDFYDYFEAMKDDLEYINNILINTGSNNFISNEDYFEISKLLEDIILDAATKIGTIMTCVKCQKQIKRNYCLFGYTPKCFSCNKEDLQ